MMRITAESYGLGGHRFESSAPWAREIFQSHWQVHGAEFAKTASTGKDTTMNSKYFHEHDEES